MKNNGKIKNAVTTMLVCAGLSGIGMQGVYKANADRAFQKTYNERVQIEEQVMLIKLNALKNAGGLPDDYNITENIKNYLQEKNSDFEIESKQYITEQKKSAVGIGVAFGLVTGGVLSSRRYKKEENELEK